VTGPAQPDSVRGCPVLVERAHDAPLVWAQVAVRGGAAADPAGREGLTRHMAELARRGAGSRDRATIDRALDQLGASMSVSAGRDWFAVNVLCLSRHLDAALAMAADVLAAPTMAETEHEKLVREAHFALDDLRDDDSSLLARYFQREVAAGHPYGRTGLGTRESLSSLTVDQARERYRRAVVPANMVIGFAGDIDEQTAARHASALLARLPDGQAAEPAEVGRPIPARDSRHVLLVDKPDRAQAQIAFGHGIPRYGTEAFDALSVVETIFGGTFTSRLMQEIRVKRGWSYGTGCVLGRAVGPTWLRVYLSPASDVAPDALALALELYERLVADGVTDDEVEFCQSYLRGSWAFARATARSRLRQRLHATLSGIGEEFVVRWPERMRAVTRQAANDAARTHLHPDRLVVAIVATADDLQPRLRERLGDALGRVAVESYESY